MCLEKDYHFRRLNELFGNKLDFPQAEFNRRLIAALEDPDVLRAVEKAVHAAHVQEARSHA